MERTLLPAAGATTPPETVIGWRWQRAGQSETAQGGPVKVKVSEDLRTLHPLVKAFKGRMEEATAVRLPGSGSATLASRRVDVATEASVTSVRQPGRRDAGHPRPQKERPVARSLLAAGGGHSLAVVVLQFTARCNQHRAIERHDQLGETLELFGEQGVSNWNSRATWWPRGRPYPSGRPTTSASQAALFAWAYTMA